MAGLQLDQTQGSCVINTWKGWDITWCWMLTLCFCSCATTARSLSDCIGGDWLNDARSPRHADSPSHGTLFTAANSVVGRLRVTWEWLIHGLISQIEKLDHILHGKTGRSSICKRGPCKRFSGGKYLCPVYVTEQWGHCIVWRFSFFCRQQRGSF